MGTARKNQMDALDLIVQQHDEVDGLIERLETEELEDQQKMFVFFELADKLAAHAAMEEQLFYPAVRAKQTEDMLLEATEEHLQIKRMLADLLGTELDDERFEAKLNVLKEEVQHHAREEEEAELLPAVRRLMSEDELYALGSEMLSLFEQLLTARPRDHVKSETRKPADF